MPHILRASSLRRRVSGKRLMRALGLSLTYALAAPSMVHAADGGLTLELNRSVTTERGCMLSFVASNGSARDVTGVVYELVLFNAEGLVEKMTAFDFGSLPASKTVVRQFELAGQPCEGLSQVLVNGAPRCDLAKGSTGGETPSAPATACIADLTTSSRATLALLK
ncbi:hypothetical protein [Roseibium aestuarii]|uniref:Tat pathway signal sequence domain protein n=1 Tax=Roseibium aestuarii TaxID=2600299 RepID=A0ABW4JV28_9HYPH|nr:hypothetical protein [Roseibium aestuarii]